MIAWVEGEGQGADLAARSDGDFPFGRRSVGMEPLREFLNAVRHHGTARGHLLGLLHILIGRRITRTDGTPVSGGMTWRELAALLKQLRWDREAVRELKLDPADLPPRDRERFWYTAIAQAGRGFGRGQGGGRPPCRTSQGAWLRRRPGPRRGRPVRLVTAYNNSGGRRRPRSGVDCRECNLTAGGRLRLPCDGGERTTGASSRDLSSREKSMARGGEKR